ncbi:pro-resilin-like, partial [Hyalella azteca]|uniref:Pro-resilin-like n=1 Tax=Hyalella azteca TaxID=294128 RepID=A0A8B7P4J2_HYAAZ
CWWRWCGGWVCARPPPSSPLTPPPLSSPSPSSPTASSGSDEDYDEAKYVFEWQVADDGSDFGQTETRDGDHTRGSYVVGLPDGRRQTVTYHVTQDSGYVADVTYQGEAQYPQQRHVASRPAYTN